MNQTFFFPALSLKGAFVCTDESTRGFPRPSAGNAPAHIVSDYGKDKEKKITRRLAETVCLRALDLINHPGSIVHNKV